LADLVVFISAFMARKTSWKEKSGPRAFRPAPPRVRYLLPDGRKSSKSGTFRTGKIIPSNFRCGDATTGTAPQPHRWSRKQKREEYMYIGLGGLLILILILWLLGVI
jgi:hypothetical protein